MRPAELEGKIKRTQDQRVRNNRHKRLLVEQAGKIEQTQETRRIRRHKRLAYFRK